MSQLQSMSWTAVISLGLNFSILCLTTNDVHSSCHVSDVLWTIWKLRKCSAVLEQANMKFSWTQWIWLWDSHHCVHDINTVIWPVSLKLRSWDYSSSLWVDMLRSLRVETLSTVFCSSYLRQQAETWVTRAKAHAITGLNNVDAHNLCFYPFHCTMFSILAIV